MFNKATVVPPSTTVAIFLSGPSLPTFFVSWHNAAGLSVRAHDH
jgi:hypothetical protein